MPRTTFPCRDPVATVGDMPTTHALPDDVELVRTTDEWTPQSAPVGLRRAHRVADGVWGRLVVRSGSVDFVFEDEPDHVITVRAGQSQVIPPQLPHHVEFTGEATFAIEFHRRPREARPAPEEGRESTGLTGGDDAPPGEDS